MKERREKNTGEERRKEERGEEGRGWKDDKTCERKGVWCNPCIPLYSGECMKSYQLLNIFQTWGIFLGCSSDAMVNTMTKHNSRRKGLMLLTDNTVHHRGKKRKSRN